MENFFATTFNKYFWEKDSKNLFSVDKWWNSIKVQEARAIFVDQFAKTSPRWEKIWIHELLYKLKI